MSVADLVDGEMTQVGCGELACDFIYGERGEEGIVKVPPQNVGFVGGIGIEQLLCLIEAVGPEQVHDEHRRSRPGKAFYCFPQVLRIRQVVQQAVADHRLVALPRHGDVWQEALNEADAIVQMS